VTWIMLGSTTYRNHRLKQQETKTRSVSVTDEILLPERKLFLSILNILSAAHCGNCIWVCFSMTAIVLYFIQHRIT